MKDINLGHLDQFTGSENFTPYAFAGHNYLLSEGTHYLAENGGAYWIVDQILLQQYLWKSNDIEPVQLWELSVFHDKTGYLRCSDGNDLELRLIPIEYVHFPFSVTLWLVDNTLLLPTEY